MTQAKWDAVDGYFEDTLLGKDAALDRALIESKKAGLPPISVSPLQGRMLTLLAQSRGAKRILEIGTLGGYSTICLASALPRGGRLTTLEINPDCARVATANIKRAGLASVVDVRLGRGLDTLATLNKVKARFDFIFIDADKETYPDYFRAVMPLASPGCVIIADNVVREGEVVKKTSSDIRVQGVRSMLALAAADPRITATAIQTVGMKGYDGFAMMIVNPRRSSSRRAS
jgi:predicted O-methyltransferase YrrM